MRSATHRRLRAIRITLGLAVAASLLFAGGAFAATVTATGTTYSFTAAAGEAQALSVTQTGTTVTISDGNANPVTADAAALTAGCTQDNASTVSCPTTGITGITFSLGDLDDTLATAASVTVPITADGGDGNDALEGTNLADALHGGNGNDVLFGDGGFSRGGGGPGGDDQLFGDAGADQIFGGRGDDVASGGGDADFISGGPGADHVSGDAGSDTLFGGPGAGNPSNPDAGDVVSGGTGVDTYVYQTSSASTVAISITLDDLANDGVPGENDNVGSDVEDVTTSQGPFPGQVPPNPMTLTGSAGVNSLTSGDGNDTIDPGSNNDIVTANGGDDTINVRDGYADRVSCGSGNDTVTADTLDIVSDDCETVSRLDVGNANEDHPPTIAWVTPADNARLSTSSPTALTVTATDDKGISQVIFTAGTRVLCVVKTAPYTCAFSPTDADVGRTTLTAMAVDTSQQTATALKAVSVPRFTPTKLSAKTTPKRDARFPFHFTTSGRLTLPAGVSAGAGCNGKVVVTFKAGAKTISTRRASLTKSCTYRSAVTFTIPRRLHPKTLRVFVTFRGNAVLLVKNAKRYTVRVT